MSPVHRLGVDTPKTFLFHFEPATRDTQVDVSSTLTLPTAFSVNASRKPGASPPEPCAAVPNTCLCIHLHMQAHRMWMGAAGALVPDPSLSATALAECRAPPPVRSSAVSASNFQGLQPLQLLGFPHFSTSVVVRVESRRWPEKRDVSTHVAFCLIHSKVVEVPNKVIRSPRRDDDAGQPLQPPSAPRTPSTRSHWRRGISAGFGRSRVSDSDSRGRPRKHAGKSFHLSDSVPTTTVHHV